MKINQSILTDLLERTPIPPPETGGILGGQAGVITRYYADMGVSHMPAHYMPHADILNRVIERWKAERIDFYGTTKGIGFYQKGTYSTLKRSCGECRRQLKHYTSRLYFPNRKL